MPGANPHGLPKSLAEGEGIQCLARSAKKTKVNAAPDDGNRFQFSFIRQNYRPNLTCSWKKEQATSRSSLQTSFSSFLCPSPCGNIGRRCHDQEGFSS